MSKEFTIKQVAEVTGLSIDTLRYYERIGLIDSVGRNQSGHRRYTQQDIHWIDLLIRLRRTGMPLAEMVRFAQLSRQDTTATLTERRMMLERYEYSLQQYIEELQQHLSHLQWKIAHFKEREMQQAAESSLVEVSAQGGLSTDAPPRKGT